MTALIPLILASTLSVNALAAVPTDVLADEITWVTANSVATGDQDYSAVAANRNGHVAVVWEDDRGTTNPADDAQTEIYLRLFKDGTSVYEKKLSAGGNGSAWRHIRPDVGLDDKGNAVVVWADDADGNGYYDIPYRVVSPTGSVRASGRANATTAGQQIVPKVAVDPDGTPNNASATAFTVVWEDIQSGSPARIRAAGYTNITTKAYEVTVSQSGGEHHRPDVAVSASGDAIVVWDEDADGNGYYNIGLTKLAKSNGAIVLSRRIANAEGGGQQWKPAVAANFAGDFTVAWESDHTGTAGVWARSFTAAGDGRHPEVEIAAGGIAPSTGIDDEGNVVVGWTVPGADPDVRIRGVNPDGTWVGRLADQAFSQVTTGRQEQIAVTSSPWGEVTASYTDDADGNTHDQVIMGFGAANSVWAYRARAGAVPAPPRH